MGRTILVTVSRGHWIRRTTFQGRHEFAVRFYYGSTGVGFIGIRSWSEVRETVVFPGGYQMRALQGLRLSVIVHTESMKLNGGLECLCFVTAVTLSRMRTEGEPVIGRILIQRNMLH